MGNIGAEDHFEYAPVGDIVNTASRIEGLNKRLGTWVLASESIVPDTTSTISRYLGTFLPGGKNIPVGLHELLRPVDITENLNRILNEDFPEAIRLFQQRKWSAAAAGFQECLNLCRHDGPSKFFLDLCRSFEQNPPHPDWDGVIRLEK